MKKMILNKKWFNFLILIGFFLGVKQLYHSFFIFYDNIDTLGNENQWKFYTSLTGFILFSLLFLALIVVTILRKTKNNMA